MSEDIENRTMRCQVEGAIPLAMHDPDDRRGLWARVVGNDDASITVPLRPTEIELFAGREGDDAYVKLSMGDVLTPETMEKLGDVITYTEAAYNMGHEGEEDTCGTCGADLSEPGQWLRCRAHYVAEITRLRTEFERIANPLIGTRGDICNRIAVAALKGGTNA